MKTNFSKSWALALALVTALSLQARAGTVTATLDPPQISVGESAQLTVTISGSQDQPSLPRVSGLEITPVGQSTQIEIINGSITENASNTYQITPQHDGTFVIPAIRAGNVSSQPITLQVLQGSGTATSPAQALPPPATGPVVLPSPSVASGSDEAASAPEGRFGSIRITLTKKEFYMGELIPVEIEVFIPDELQANVTDLPQFTSDGLTLNSLSTKPDQSTQVVNGRSYTVFTWHSALTGVKTGDYPISLQMPETVIVAQQMPQPDVNNDLFDNFFRNAFATIGIKKDVTIKSDTETLKILPLPEANRPAGFSGAVGQFEIEASATPTTVNAGDPVTLRLKVTGTGNFDRVFSDMLASNAQWKTYSPTSHFDPADSVGYQGMKTFEQPVIANEPGIPAIPSLSFSYFDPESGQYVTRTTAPVAVTVGGSPVSPAGSGVASAVSSSPQTQPSSSASPSPALDLCANQVEPGSCVTTLRPIYLNPWFIAGQGLPLLALLGGLFFMRRQMQASHPQRLRATAVQQAIRQQIEAMDAAMQNHQTDAFFIHARNALQQRLGHQWNLRPETITLADIEARLGDEIATVRPIFEWADQASYSDLQFEDADLRQWRQAVMNELAEKN